MSVVDIRVRNTKKEEKYFTYSAITFPDDSEILSDQIMEQMMMDGLVLSSQSLSGIKFGLETQHIILLT
jgi:hypothetical protein